MMNTQTFKPTEVQAEYSDFRLFLQSQFLAKCRINPRYTLRAFAKMLRIDASTLSQVLRGKRRLTPAIVLKLSHRLGLGPTETTRFVEHCKRSKVTPVPAIYDSKDLTLDAFQVIADWYHYAIFELVTVNGFENDSSWIARRLGISVSEAQIALERILRLELLVPLDTGGFKQGVPLVSTTGNPFTAVAFRKLQAQVLTKALQALEETPMERRDQSSMTMAMDSRRLPEAKEKIKNFRRELCAFLQQDPERNSVYQLGISLYPLTLEGVKDE